VVRRGEGGEILVGRGQRRHWRDKLGWAEMSIGQRQAGELSVGRRWRR